MKRNLLLLIVFNTLHLQGIERPIVVVVPSYNNSAYYQKNIDSIVSQKYANFHLIYIDDCSNDGTAQKVEAYIVEHNLGGKVSLVKNTMRRGAMYNHYTAAHAAPNHAIIVTVDGDDWLADEAVLARVNEAYQDDAVWMTYGQFQEYPSGRKGFCKQLPDGVKRLGVYRDCGFMTSHLRTYYAGLFKQIPVGYFIRQGAFLRAGCDLAIMFGLLELSGGRVAFIEDLLYIYNTANVNSDCRTRMVEQLRNDYWVRSRQPLRALQTLPTDATKSITRDSLYNIHISSYGDL